MQDKPVVVIDFANNLIRIHKKTITSLNSPESILLIINPEKLTKEQKKLFESLQKTPLDNTQEFKKYYK